MKVVNISNYLFHVFFVSVLAKKATRYLKIIVIVFITARQQAATEQAQAKRDPFADLGILGTGLPGAPPTATPMTTPFVTPMVTPIVTPRASPAHTPAHQPNTPARSPAHQPDYRCVSNICYRNIWIVTSPLMLNNKDWNVSNESHNNNSVCHAYF